MLVKKTLKLQNRAAAPALLVIRRGWVSIGAAVLDAGNHQLGGKWGGRSLPAGALHMRVGWGGTRAVDTA